MAIPGRDGSPDTEVLLRDAAQGDAAALHDLFEMHRERLRRMVALRLDRRLIAVVDASDVVQEALVDAARKLPDYADRRPLPFYPWLYCLARERLIQQQRRKPLPVVPLDGSAVALVDLLADSEPTPGSVVVREERRERVRADLEALPDGDREVLVMRYLEELTFSEIAAILGIGEGAAKMRHLRALRRIRDVMRPPGAESSA
jgi:RNA polymerase sigma-70 factor (ECF subfamily)